MQFIFDPYIKTRVKTNVLKQPTTKKNCKIRTLLFRISTPDVRATCRTCKGDRPIAKKSC